MVPVVVVVVVVVVVGVVAQVSRSTTVSLLTPSGKSSNGGSDVCYRTFLYHPATWSTSSKTEASPSMFTRIPPDPIRVLKAPILDHYKQLSF